jgi:tol-pal system protein YbgF
MAGAWTAAPVALALVVAAPVAQAQNNPDPRDLQIRLQRLERDMRDLQAMTFRRGDARDGSDRDGSGRDDSPQADDAPPPDAAGDATGTPNLAPVMRRVDELEDGMGRITGQLEELGHKVDQLSERTDRLQKELDFQTNPPPNGFGNGPDAGAAPGGPDGGRPDGGRTGSGPNNSGALASLPPDNGRNLAPSSGTLGQLPAPLRGGPQNQGPALQSDDPKRDYDAAQALLNRAQYERAGAAFRSFVDAHPDSELAPHALYRTGDIAFSVQKNYDVAARDFAELLKKYPKAPDAPDGMLKLGLSLVTLGQTKEGCAALAALPAKYPAADPAVANRARAERRNAKCR